MDWKDMLASLKDLPEGEATASDVNDTKSADSEASPASKQKEPVYVSMEKKGRGGKTATILAGFTISDEEIAETARTLRQRLGTGGSSRGGEILIQGDRREDVKKLLRELGFKNIKG